MDLRSEEEGRAFAVVDRERRVSLGAESSSSSGEASEGTSYMEEESSTATAGGGGDQGLFDVSLKSESFYKVPFHSRGGVRTSSSEKDGTLIDLLSSSFYSSYGPRSSSYPFSILSSSSQRKLVPQETTISSRSPGIHRKLTTKTLLCFLLDGFDECSWDRSGSCRYQTS